MRVNPTVSVLQHDHHGARLTNSPMNIGTACGRPTAAAASSTRL